MKLQQRSLKYVAYFGSVMFDDYTMPPEVIVKHLFSECILLTLPELFHVISKCCKDYFTVQKLVN